MDNFRNTRRLVFAGALIAGILAGPAVPSSADPVGDKTAQAAAIAAQIATNGDRISALGEQYNGARLKLEAAQDAVMQATAKIESTQRTVDATQALVRTRAAVAYRQASSGRSTSAFDLKDASKALRYQKYADAQATQDDALLAKLEAARGQLAKQKADAEAARTEAETQARQISDTKASLEAANNQQAQLLHSVQGDLALLVSQEQQRRDATTLASAQAKYGTGTTSAPSGGSGGSAPAAPAPSASPAPAAPSAPAPAPGAAAIAIAFARAQLGKPYVYAAAGPNTWDCSGLTMMAYAAAGISMPHYSGWQWSMFPKVSMNALQPGDLVFWGSYASDHVGIYIGGGQVIHAPHTGDVVKISAIWGSPWGAARPW